MKSFAVTDVGLKRTINQDCYYCEESSVGNLSNLFLVADGMGGHKAGDMASKTCVEVVCDSIRNSKLRTPVSLLEEAILCSHNSILNKSIENPDFEGMGTTLVASTIVDDVLYVANIGDSRLYLLRDTLSQITEDHSLVEEMVKSGEITKENVRSHPNKNIITRALGIGNAIKPDYFEVDVKEGDIILMCSDGLSNMLEDSEIEYIIKSNRENLEKTVITLVDRANEAGGKDNITVLIVEM